MNRNAKKLIFLTVVFYGLLVNASHAQVSTDLRNGIELLQRGELNESIAALETMAASNPGDRAMRDYHLAIAKYRLGDIESARSLFASSAVSPNREVAANSRYNLGNCEYAEALTLREKAAENEAISATIKKLKSAITRYRSALRLDPENADARANIELAARLIRELQEQQKQQDRSQKTDKDQQKQNQDKKEQQEEKQQQDDQQQDGQKQDGQKQDGQKQENEDQPSQNSNDQNPPEQQGKSEPDGSKDGDKKSGQNQPDEQPQDSQKPDQSKPDGSKNQDQKPGQPKDSESRDPASTNDKNSSQRKQPSSNQDMGEPEPEANDSPDKASSKNFDGKLTTENMKEGAGQIDENSFSAGKKIKRLMTREEALKMLQAVRDRDMLRRLRKQQRRRSQRLPGKKDW